MNIIGKYLINTHGMKTTETNKTYWRQRKIDWKKHYLDTWNHPHRQLIVDILKITNFGSLWEVGCGSGPNILRIVKEMPTKQLGGSDINADAIKLAKETFTGGMFNVESGDNMMMSDSSTDIILSDMVLIYVGAMSIKKYLKEFKRVARQRVILVEFHSESLLERIVARFKGYNVYNYKTLLEKLGFYDIIIYKIPEHYWGKDDNSKFRSLIIAKI